MVMIVSGVEGTSDNANRGIWPASGLVKMDPSLANAEPSGDIVACTPILPGAIGRLVAGPTVMLVHPNLSVSICV
jgi:hypothetical protein